MLEINIIREIGKNIYDLKNWAIENPQSEMQRGKKNETNKQTKKNRTIPYFPLRKLRLNPAIKCIVSTLLYALLHNVIVNAK